MASCNLTTSGSSAIHVNAYVTEETDSGTERYVTLCLTVQSGDGYTGGRDAGYSVSCAEAGADIEVPMYSGDGFTVSGTEKEIFNESFYVSVDKGSSSADISLSFSVSMYSSAAGGNVTTKGTITTLYLAAEPDAGASTVTLGASSVQMGKKSKNQHQT